MNNKHDPIIEVDINGVPTNAKPSRHDPIIQTESESTAVSVDTESSITPISRKEIDKVDASDWNTLTVGELYDQLATLEQRKMFCQQYSPTIVNQIEQGIARLRAIINVRQSNEVKLL